MKTKQKTMFAAARAAMGSRLRGTGTMLKMFCMTFLALLFAGSAFAELAFIVEEDIQTDSPTVDQYATSRTTDEIEVSDTALLSIPSCQDSTNFFVRIRNPYTGKSVRLTNLSERRDTIRLTSLLIRELRHSSLGDGTNAVDCSLIKLDADGKEKIVEKVALRSREISLPQFRYGPYASSRLTEVNERTLHSVSLIAPRLIFSDDATVEQQEAAIKEAEENMSIYCYEYELPNGDFVYHLETNPDIADNVTSSSVAGGFEITNLDGSMYYMGSEYCGEVSPMSDNMLNAMSFACSEWSKILKLTVPVKIVTGLDKSLPYNVIGSTYNSPSYYDSSKSCRFPYSLINQIKGYDVDVSSADIYIVFNPKFPFYLGTDGKCPSTKQDFLSTALHELNHGLGFASNHRRIIQTDGSYTVDGSYNNGQPSIYDMYLYSDGRMLKDATQSQRAKAYTSNSLYWDGTNAKVAYGGKRPKLYAPSKYNSGSSVSHWDDSNSFETFMTYASGYGDVCHVIDAVTIGALKDIGYTLVSDEDSFSISPNGNSFGATSDAGSFSVKAGIAWTVRASDSWIKLKTNSGSGNGTIAYTIEANTSVSVRNGTIIVTGSNGKEETYWVKQSGTMPILTVKPETADFGDMNSHGSFSVTANSAWSATCSDSWITLENMNGTGSGVVSYSVLENTGSQRTGTITVTSGSLTETHKVTQAAKPQIELEPGAKTFTADAGSGTIAVTSDSMWTVSKSETWIRLETTTGTGNGTIKYSVLENTGSKREGWIYVKSGSVQKSFRVTQCRRDTVTFSEESATVPYSGGSGSFTVTVLANNYYITTTASEVKWASWTWTKEQVTEGYRYTCNYTVQAAPSYEKRTVKIPIVLNETTYYFTITQGFGADTYRVSYEPGANGRGFAFYNLKTHDVPLTLSSSKFTRSGYTQKGWATIDGGAKAYDFGASYTKNEAITLYPYWEMDSGSAPTTYTIHFSPGTYGVGFNQTATKYKGVSLALPGAIYTREGYEQTGWSTVRSGTTKSYNLGGAYTTDAGAYLYPYWTEKVTESFDIGFYTPSAYKQPVCLSTTNIAYWAYAPQYVFEPGGGLVLNYCAANYSVADATLVDKYMSLWDKDYNKIESEMESYADTISAGSGALFPNRNLSSWLSSISPGNYLLMTYLDPYNKLNDPDDSNNSWQTWFAVKAEGITLNEALDCSSLYFTDDGTTAFPQTSESVVGGSCVQLGPQPTNSYDTVLCGYVTEPGTLSFKWKASGNNYKNCMVFYVGDDMKTWKWGGQGDWETATVEISESDVASGYVWVSWELWTYDADMSVLTAGWVDNVVWNPSGRKPTFTVDAAGTLTGVELNGMTDIEIPSMVNSTAVRSIGYCALTNSAVTSVSIPETVTNIERFAFYNNQRLSGVTIPGSVRSIGECAFNACGSLKSVVLNEGVTTIDGYAFYNCGSLSTVLLPASVKNLGPSPFGKCDKLTTIAVASGNWYYIVENNALIDISSRTLIQYPSGRPESEYEVPEGLFAIGYDAFDNVARLERVVVPASVTVLEGYAFWKCQNLQAIVFKGDAPSVGQYALSGLGSSCKALVSPQSSGWGVGIPGTWQGIGIEYSAALQTYAVTYSPGTYGTGSQTSEVKSYGITLPLKGAIFTRTGYLQTGWATSDGGAKAYELGASYTSNAAATLYPYWTANSYGIAYELDGGESGAYAPASADYGTAFRVSAPTRDGYVFMGWMVTVGLDITTARYGESVSNQSTEIDNASQQCFNGSDVDVWFINLTPVADGNVTLTATWEPVPDDSRDIGFYAPASKGWAFPVCLSSTNIEYLAYAPQTEFMQFSDVFLSFCAVNWSRAGSALLQSTLLTITDENGNIFDQGEPIQLKQLGAFGYGEIRNMSLRRYMSGITPGRYKLTLELDPNRLLVDPDRSNNTTSIWFTVSAPTDPIPELPTDATAADVRIALAGSADGRLVENISDVSTYTAYREWARGAKGSDNKPVGVAFVKTSDKAWFSFAVDSPKLIDKEIVSDDVKIEDFVMASNGGQFDFTVGITDVTIGDGATMARLKTVFGIEGAASFDNSAFSSDNLTLETAEPEHGKVKLTVRPAAPKTGNDPSASAFFMRVKVN